MSRMASTDTNMVYIVHCVIPLLIHLTSMFKANLFVVDMKCWSHTGPEDHLEAPVNPH